MRFLNISRANTHICLRHGAEQNANFYTLRCRKSRDGKGEDSVMKLMLQQCVCLRAYMCAYMCMLCHSFCK